MSEDYKQRSRRSSVPVELLSQGRLLPFNYQSQNHFTLTSWLNARLGAVLLNRVSRVLGQQLGRLAMQSVLLLVSLLYVPVQTTRFMSILACSHLSSQRLGSVSFLMPSKAFTFQIKHLRFLNQEVANTVLNTRIENCNIFNYCKFGLIQLL